MSGASTKPWAWIALLACTAFPACETYGFNIDAALVRMTLDGDIALGPSGGGPADLSSIDNDIDDSLGLDDEERTPSIGVDFWYEKMSISMSTLWYGQDSSGILDQDYGNIPQGSPVSTSADIIQFKAAVYYDLIDEGPFRLSPGIGMEYMDLDFSATFGGLTDSLDVGIPMPMLFLRAEGDIGPITASMEVGGFSADLLGIDATLVDLDFKLRLNPIPLVEVFAGYRMLLLDAKGDDGGQDFETDFRLHGWMIGVEIPF